MPKPKIPSDLMNELNSAAFGADEKSYEKIFKALSREQIANVFPDRAKLLRAIETVAFQKNADVFQILLNKFSDDEEAIRAVLKGFKRDERFCNQSSDGWGGPSGFNIQELGKKRDILQNFIIELGKKNAPKAEDIKTKSAIPVKSFMGFKK